MPRFLTLTDVAEELQISMAQARAIVRSGELPAIQIGGRGQWRVEQVKLDEYIQGLYAEQAAKAEARRAVSPQTEDA
ncbi:DNA-binding protein [Citricoccus sp. SGAir0253]|uniref:helix-turn-helix domain-containing protein n=1 Tax=Citricoccus sp. SGAir0253 TaxID=2567881 RepID=UPI0010CCD103|nr:helix-turn-helix domain-containing protein [Citricoccus sp. SGAir0253]QCU77755.1 DNA-binding protein [Citricoccus sp. SGAir0253]